jgi:hypothetical protein
LASGAAFHRPHGSLAQSVHQSQSTPDLEDTTTDTLPVPDTNQPTTPSQLHIFRPSSKPHPRYSRTVRLTRHQRMKYSSPTNRCAEADTDTNETSNHLPICASNRHIPARAHSPPHSSHLSRLDCVSIHPVVHLSLPTPTKHPTT